MEAASGVAGLIKVILSLRHKLVPPHLHLREVNPAIDVEAIPAMICREPTAWPADGRPRLAGVSSFGASGTLAHIVVQEAPVRPIIAAVEGRPLHLLALSARTDRALRKMAASLHEFVLTHPTAKLEDICFTANAGRSHFEHRRAMVAITREQLAEKLARLAGGAESGMLHGLVERSAQPVKVVFAVNGAAPVDWAGARTLLATSPVFRAAVDRCENVFWQHRTSLVQGIVSGGRDCGLGVEAAIALQWAASRLWRSWGIEPAIVWEKHAPGILAACVGDELDINDILRTALDTSDRGFGVPLTVGDIRVEYAGGRNFSDLDPDLAVALSAFDWRELTERLSRLYVRGAAVDWAGFHRGSESRKLELPTYPFQRQRCWVEGVRQVGAVPQAQPHTNAPAATGLLGGRLSLAGSSSVRYETRLRADQPMWLKDHRIGGRIVLPATAYIAMALESASDAAGSAVALDAVSFARPLVIGDEEVFTLQTVLTPTADGRTAFTIFSRPGEECTNGHWIQHATGTISVVAAPGECDGLPDIRRRCSQVVPVDRFYAALDGRGFEFGPAFRAVRSLHRGMNEALGHVHVTAGTETQAYRIHPALLDACSQVVAAVLTPPVATSDFFMLVGMERMVSHAAAGQEAWCYARPSAHQGIADDRYRADLTIFDSTGCIIAEVIGLTYQRVAAEISAPLTQTAGGNGLANGKLCGRLQAAAHDERLGMLESHVIEQMARILGLDGRPDPRTGFFDLGMDSLSAAELVSTLNHDLDRSFPATILFEHGNASALARYLLLEVSPRPEEARANGKGNGHAAPSGNLDDMSPEQIAQMFVQMLTDLEGPTS